MKDCTRDYDYKNWLISWSKSGWNIGDYDFTQQQTEGMNFMGLRFKTINEAKKWIDKNSEECIAFIKNNY